MLRISQPIVDSDAADNCPLYFTTMIEMSFQDDIRSISTDNFKNQYVLVFDLTSMQDATVECHYPTVVREPLRLELNFNFRLEHVTDFNVLEERMLSFAVDYFGVGGKKSQMASIALKQIIRCIFLLVFGYLRFFPQFMFQMSLLRLLSFWKGNRATLCVNSG